MKKVKSKKGKITTLAPISKAIKKLAKEKRKTEAAPVVTDSPPRMGSSDQRTKTKPTKTTKKEKGVTKKSDVNLAPEPVVAPARVGGIYTDQQRNSCIVCHFRHGGEQVLFVTMENNMVDRYKLPKAEFERRFKELPGYPLDRALAIYKRVGGTERITERAKRALEILMEPKLQQEQLQLTREKETEMKKAAGKIKTGSTKEKKAKFDKSQFFTRERAAELIKKNEKGGKLKKFRDNDKREGSTGRAVVDAIQSCGTIKAALEKVFTFKGKKLEVSFNDLRSAVRRRYVEIFK